MLTSHELAPPVTSSLYVTGPNNILVDGLTHGFRGGQRFNLAIREETQKFVDLR